MKFYTLLMTCLSFCILTSCVNKQQRADESTSILSAQQEKLLQQGWSQDRPDGGDLNADYGIEPVYGVQDNYFDIRIGKGCCVAVKIVNAETKQPIRYVYIPEEETVTVSQIPQGIYFLKLAYGNDWMELDEDSIKRGRFTRDVSYEKSASTYDFGKKNSQSFVNYTLEINVINGDTEHEFKTMPITEEEFENN